MSVCVGGSTVALAKLVLDPLASSPLKRPVHRAIPAVKVVSSEIIKEIQNADNTQAYFVLPSQLNGAEYPDYTVVVSNIADYRFDGTGGPRAQLAVHPAVGQFLLDNAAHSKNKRGIDATRDLLEAMRLEGHDHFTLENGYLRITPLGSREQESAVADAFEKQLWRLRSIASQQVNAVGLAPNLRVFSEASHSVNLVYASSVPVGTYNNPETGPTSLQYQQQISSLVMRGMYFGTLRLALAARGVPGAALDSDSHASCANTAATKVFLMPIGGGVFNNSTQAIAQSISEAIELADDLFCSGRDSSDSITKHLDIRLLAWEGKPSEAQEFQSCLQKCEKLKV